MAMHWTTDDYLHYIIKQTNKHNIDNIERTNAYEKFYRTHPEIKWALVASIVSRNAGWNMTDLSLSPYKKILNHKERQRLFMTYERANWLIFSDAYPQLLVYQLSLLRNQPLFHLLDELHVSRFMKREWTYFWKTTDRNRLMHALIINEQHVIDQPVIKQPFFKDQVFSSFPYILQNFFMMNAVLIPTKSSRIYGEFVRGFTNVEKRIRLGKKVASIVYSRKIYRQLLEFIHTIDHTGSRRDYEQFLNIHLPPSPMLRLAYPNIRHKDQIRKDWLDHYQVKKTWFTPIMKPNLQEMSLRFYSKRYLLYAYSRFKQIFSNFQ